MYATKQLRDDHEQILVVLSVLEHLGETLEEGKPVNQDHLAQILDFLRTYADKCHHGKEEDLLFPALGSVGIPTQGGPVGVMLHEHALGRGYIQGMVQALERMQAGQNARGEFADNALCYVGLLRDHIAKENDILFVMAEQYLNDDEHARLTEQFARVEHERIGPGAQDHYYALIDRLRDTYFATAAAR